MYIWTICCIDRQLSVHMQQFVVLNDSKCTYGQFVVLIDSKCTYGQFVVLIDRKCTYGQFVVLIDVSVHMDNLLY